MKNKIRFWHFPVIIIAIISGCNKENVVSTLKLKPSPWVVYGSMTDQDGNAYKTLQIGMQTWMVENLKTTRFNNGTAIPLISDVTYWNNLSTPACCWQYNNPAYRVTYGILYNWYAVNTNKLCPDGWHVATDADWSELSDYLGGENTAGGKLKESGLRHWNSPNLGATDEAHFRALPGGSLNSSDSIFQNLHEMGCWWTSSSFSSDFATSRFMFTDNDNIQKLIQPKKWGMSVRCVWNY